MAIVKMKFVEASTDEAHRDAMLLQGMNSGLLDVTPADQIVTDENGGQMISQDNPFADYKQTLQNFAHAVGFTFDETKKPSRTYTKEEIESFLSGLNETFGINSDSAEVILTPDDEKALAALSECGFEKIHACRYLNFGFGRMPRESFPKLSAYRDVNFVHHRLHDTKQYIWMAYVTSDSYADQVANIFKSLYFEPMEIPNVDVHRLLHEYEDKLNDLWAYCSQENEIISRYKYISVFDKKQVLSGFVTADSVEKYKETYKDLPVEFTVKDPEEVPQLQCPTLLKNNWFARPFELYVDMYSMPAYGDFDPTFFLAITYCILFGIMFGDMGQGIVLMLIGFLFEKKGRLFGIIGRVGITSTIMGFLFGSLFGYEDALNPLHQKLFHVREKLFDVMANSNTMTLLGGALLVGAVLIACSMIINIVNNIRHKKWGEVWFSQNGVAGIFFYTYVVLAAGGYLTGAYNLLLAPFVVLFVIVPVFCFLMKEPLTNLISHKPVKPAEGWGGYMTQNVFEVLEILLSFVTNSMSYLRVGGFVLSHAGMMLVVMTLVKMTGNAGPVVLVIGNAFVMVLEGLVVGIQALRLEYYEMFSRYYTGGGRKFAA